jgi:hypothetical protein
MSNDDITFDKAEAEALLFLLGDRGLFAHRLTG